MKRRIFSLDSKVTLGGWITIGHPAVAEIMISAGLDWVAVDMEHSALTVAEVENLIRVIDLKGATALVRLTSNDSDLIKRVMDSGAHGIIVPMVKSAEDVRAAVAAVKYPPKGRRSVGLARAQGYGATFDEYRDWLESGAIIVAQIEHIEAVNNLEEILSVEGLSAFIVGPYDLTGSLGVPGDFTNPLYTNALKKIKDVAVKMNVVSGIHLIDPDEKALKESIIDGYRFIAYSIDTRILDFFIRSAIAAARHK